MNEGLHLLLQEMKKQCKHDSIAPPTQTLKALTHKVAPFVVR